MLVSPALLPNLTLASLHFPSYPVFFQYSCGKAKMQACALTGLALCLLLSPCLAATKDNGTSCAEALSDIVNKQCLNEVDAGTWTWHGWVSSV